MFHRSGGSGVWNKREHAFANRLAEKGQQPLSLCDPIMLSIIFNVYIANDDKFHRLIESISRLESLSNIEVLVSVRGPMAQRVADILEDDKRCQWKISHLELRDDGDSWMCVTKSLLEKINAETVVICQEDHWLVNSHLLWELYLDFKEKEIDYAGISFHPQVLNTSKTYGRFSVPADDTGNLTTYAFHNRKDTKDLYSLFAISLLGMFSREYLANLLGKRLEYPIFYPSSTPFVFERKFRSKSIYPLRLAVPKFEIFACVDDDHGIPGYSLNSRMGLVTTKQVNHRGPILDFLARVSNKYILKINHDSRLRLISIIGTPLWVKYYLDYLVKKFHI